MTLQQRNLYSIPWNELVAHVKASFPQSAYDHAKHAIFLLDKEGSQLGYIRLPLHYYLDDSFEIANKQVIVIYLSIESGNAALHVWKGEENVYHTTFGAYMTRKKQGFSQVKYLNKKGKSRAGSRIRLKSTEIFFEQINETLTELLEEHQVDRIAISCASTLWPYLFNGQVTCPFDKKDERLYKIPLHISQSNHTNLTAAVKKLKAPLLFYESKWEGEMNELIKVLTEERHRS